MKKKSAWFVIISILIIFFPGNLLYAQNGAYLIPRTIYVGDPAVLVLPVAGANQETVDIILTAGLPDFPTDPNIDFHRIILEKRAGGSRLMIEFSAFVPGELEFPEIEIDGKHFSGLTINVNSLIDNRITPVLSGPASSLAMPGTALLLYGTMAFLIIVLLTGLLLITKGRKLLHSWGEKWKRWKLFTSMKITEKRLNRSVLKGGNERLILDLLSEEFKKFLSYLTGINCSVMTAREFGKLHIELFKEQEFNQSFLPYYFQSCDELRFSGGDVSSEDILRLLADLRLFIKALENAKKGKPVPANIQTKGSSRAQKENKAA